MRQFLPVPDSNLFIAIFENIAKKIWIPKLKKGKGVFFSRSMRFCPFVDVAFSLNEPEHVFFFFFQRTHLLFKDLFFVSMCVYLYNFKRERVKCINNMKKYVMLRKYSHEVNTMQRCLRVTRFFVFFFLGGGGGGEGSAELIELLEFGKSQFGSISEK